MKRFVIMLFATITLSFMLTGCNAQKEDMPSAKEEALEMMGKIENALSEMDEDWSKKSMTTATPITYADADGNEIIYYFLETEYFDTEDEYDGLNEDAFKCVLEIDLAEIVRECNENDYNAIIYEYGERTYLCWSITEAHSCILEYSPDFISEDEIFKMAESVE